MAIADWIRLLILSVLWGGSFFFVEIAVADLPALTIVWARVSLAALVLGLTLIVSGIPMPRGRKVWAALAVMGLLNNALPFSLFVLAQGQITSSLAAVLNATTPLWTVLVAHMATTDEKLTLPKLSGVACGVAGVAVMMAGPVATLDIRAIGACLLAAMCYACAGVWGRRFRKLGLAPLSTAFGQVSAATLILLPVWVWVDQPWHMGLPDLDSAGALVGIAVLSTALAYLIYFQLLASAGATNLLLVTFLIPVSATLLGVFILGEGLEPRQIAGFGLIACGLAAIDGVFATGGEARLDRVCLSCNHSLAGRSKRSFQKLRCDFFEKIGLRRRGSGKTHSALGLRLPAQKIPDQPQPGGLAFFGVELGADDVVPAHNGGDRPGIVDMRQQMRRVVDQHRPGMDEIGVIAGGKTGQHRMGCINDQIIPAHMRDFERRVGRSNPGHLPPDPVKAGGWFVFVALRGQHLHADTDPKKGDGAPFDCVGNRPGQPRHRVQSGPAGRKGPVARQHDPGGAGDGIGVRGDHYRTCADLQRHALKGFLR